MRPPHRSASAPISSDLHHDDETVSAKEAFGRKYFAERKLDIECVAAAEGASLSLQG